METETKKIIEINGIKMEIDLRSATLKQLDTFKVGDPVKVLIKKYENDYISHAGVIIGFDNYSTNPTILVMYVDESYSEKALQMLYINQANKDNQIVHAHEDDILFSKETVLSKLNREIDKAKVALEDAEQRKDLFYKYFNKVIEFSDRLKDTQVA